jgi:peptide/nickel transport system permease protein
MTKYFIRRLLQVIPVVLVVVVFNFALVRLAPGDPIQYIIGEATVGDEVIAQIRRNVGLDRPVHEQLVIYLSNLARGDLGFSYVSHQPVIQRIGERLPATLTLMVTQLVVAVIAGVALGTIAARRPGSATDVGVSILSVFGYAMPVFFLGQMLILVFALQLDLLPAQGMSEVRGTTLPPILDLARHLVLPVTTLALFNLALIARITRTSVVDIIDQDFVRTARSKGLTEGRIMTRHVLPNALLPVITVIGLNFRTLIAGAVLTETVFGWPGVGRLTYDSIFARDYPVILGVLLLTGVFVAVGNLVTDLTYGLIDPRVRLR